MLKLFTFWSAKHNDVIYAIAYSREEAIKTLKKKLINADDDSYIIGSSIKCIEGAYGSTTIIK